MFNTCLIFMRWIRRAPCLTNPWRGPALALDSGASSFLVPPGGAASGSAAGSSQAVQSDGRNRWAAWDVPGGPDAADCREPPCQAQRSARHLVGAAGFFKRGFWSGLALPAADGSRRATCCGRQGPKRGLRFGAVRRVGDCMGISRLVDGAHAVLSGFYTALSIANVTSLLMVCPTNGGFFGVFLFPHRFAPRDHRLRTMDQAVGERRAQ